MAPSAQTSKSDKSKKSNKAKQLSSIKRDIYCWTCHMEGPLIKCKGCPRAYHRQCSENLGGNYPKPFFDSDNMDPNYMTECPECLRAKKTNYINMKIVPETELKQIFMSISRNLRDGYFWPNPFYKLEEEKSNHYKDVVAKTVDISHLENDAVSGKFRTLEEFLGETRWILHNCIITEGRCSRESTWAQELMDICKSELVAADLCPECYLREQNRDRDQYWFIKPCVRQPHVLAWAKTPSSGSFWPVKIIQWHAGDRLTVREFGEYRRFEIPSSHCYLYSELPPKNSPQKSKHTKDTRDVGFWQALTEMDAHIKELKKIVGTVDVTENVTSSLKGSTIDDALRRIFPDLKQMRDEQERENSEIW